jgi:hypothetical protein
LLVYREELSEGITDDFESREGTVGTWLECHGIAAQRWIEVEDGYSQRYCPNARAAACRHISDSRLGHKPFLFVPKSLQG